VNHAINLRVQWKTATFRQGPLHRAGDPLRHPTWGVGDDKSKIYRRKRLRPFGVFKRSYLQSFMLYFGLRLCIARGVVICGFLSPSSFRQPTLKGTIAQLLPLPVGLAFKGASKYACYWPTFNYISCNYAVAEQNEWKWSPWKVRRLILGETCWWPSSETGPHGRAWHLLFSYSSMQPTLTNSLPPMASGSEMWHLCNLMQI